jgi:phage tail-like protein
MAVSTPPLSSFLQLNHPASFRFYVLELSNIFEGAFTDVTGLTKEREVLEVKEGGVNDHVHILPGRAKYSGNIVLKRGITSSPTLWTWYQRGLWDPTKVKRFDITIILYGSIMGVIGPPIRFWNVHDAMPVKWVGPEFKTDSNQVAVESIELAHHGLTVDVPHMG